LKLHGPAVFPSRDKAL